MTRRLGEHSTLPHTADVGIEATAHDLPSLFEEAAMAVIGLTVSVSAGVAPTRWELVDLEAADVTALAFEWLNEIISLGDIGSGAVVAAHVDVLERSGTEDAGGDWTLSGRMGLHPVDGRSVSVLRQPKSATYHRLSVERRRQSWMLRAYLDV